MKTKLNSRLMPFAHLSKVLIRLSLALVVCLGAVSVRAQHGHLNAGAYGTNINDQLYFVNGAIFAADSGYVKQMDLMTTNKYAGYYAGNISFTALPGTTNLGGPAFNAPALGSFIVAEITSVDGPPGGAFGFWEGTARAPVYSVPVGTTEGSNRFELSDISIGAGLPEADPYGHIHGRNFTLSKPGVYTVGFKLYDTADYYPVHSPSEIFYIKFAGGYRLTSAAQTNGTFSFSVGLGGSTNLYIQATTNLADTNAWADVAGPLEGTNAYVFQDTNLSVMVNAFYRVVEKAP